MGLSPHSDARCKCHNTKDPRQLYLWLPATGSEETSWRELGLSPTGIAPTEIAPNGNWSHCNLLPMNFVPMEFATNEFYSTEIFPLAILIPLKLDSSEESVERLLKDVLRCWAPDRRACTTGLPDQTHQRSSQTLSDVRPRCERNTAVTGSAR